MTLNMLELKNLPLLIYIIFSNWIILLSNISVCVHRFSLTSLFRIQWVATQLSFNTRRIDEWLNRWHGSSPSCTVRVSLKLEQYIQIRVIKEKYYDTIIDNSFNALSQPLKVAWGLEKLNKDKGFFSGNGQKFILFAILSIFVDVSNNGSTSTVEYFSVRHQESTTLFFVLLGRVTQALIPTLVFHCWVVVEATKPMKSLNRFCDMRYI